MNLTDAGPHTHACGPIQGRCRRGSGAREVVEVFEEYGVDQLL
jgi:hypothetical protein